MAGASCARRPPASDRALPAPRGRHPAAPVRPADPAAGIEGFQPTAGNAAVQTLVAVQRNKGVAAKVAKKVKDQNGAPLDGYEGGRVFENQEGHLPSKDKNGNALKYWEYDVVPALRRAWAGQGTGRDRLELERLVHELTTTSPSRRCSY